MPSRAFTARDTQLDDPDPITFEVLGRAFRCVPMFAPAAQGLLDDIPRLPEPGSAEYAGMWLLWLDRVSRFIRLCIVPDERPKWDTLNLEDIVAPETMAEVMQWLTSIYADRLAAAVVAQENRAAIDDKAPAIPGIDGLVPVSELVARMAQED